MNAITEQRNKMEYTLCTCRASNEGTFHDWTCYKMGKKYPKANSNFNFT